MSIGLFHDNIQALSVHQQWKYDLGELCHMVRNPSNFCQLLCYRYSLVSSVQLINTL